MIHQKGGLKKHQSSAKANPTRWGQPHATARPLLSWPVFTANQPGGQFHPLICQQQSRLNYKIWALMASAQIFSWSLWPPSKHICQMRLSAFVSIIYRLCPWSLDVPSMGRTYFPPPCWRSPREREWIPMARDKGFSIDSFFIVPLGDGPITLSGVFQTFLITNPTIRNILYIITKHTHTLCI